MCNFLCLFATIAHYITCLDLAAQLSPSYGSCVAYKVHETTPLFCFVKSVIQSVNNFYITYLLTPWSRVLLVKQIGFQLVKKFLTFYGTSCETNRFSAGQEIPHILWNFLWNKSVFSWSRNSPHFMELLVKQIGFQLVKKFLTFYGTSCETNRFSSGQEIPHILWNFLWNKSVFS